MQYKEIRPLLKTGDIVLFSGNGFISNMIKLATRSKWSHVGMVLNIPEYDFLAIWESTSITDQVDLDTGRVTKGVQLTALSERIKHYDGEVAIRQLNKTILGVNRLYKLRRELSGRDYERSEAELMKAAYDGPLGQNREDLSSIFCSELVAEAYQSVDIIDPTIPSNEYTPANFDRCISFQNGYNLHDAINIE